jgi:hypothetical protein
VCPFFKSIRLSIARPAYGERVLGSHPWQTQER